MMKSTLLRYLLPLLALIQFPAAVLAQESPTLYITRANAKISSEVGFKNKWEGPTSGPKIEQRKLIIFIGNDLSNTSIKTLLAGVQEATTVAGWDLVPLDCWGLPHKRADAFSRALALKPDGIILAGINARDQAKEIAAAAAKKIPIVGWHAAIKNGPGDGMFTNLGADPKLAGQSAGFLAVSESNGKAGVVVFTDPSNLHSVAKSNEIVDVIKRCQTCSLLDLQEIPLTGGADKLPPILTSLAKRFGKKWTHLLVVNDMYLDWVNTPANLALISEVKPQGISAGDGSTSAYQRVQKKDLQIGIVPEPMFLQAWQLVDELNRAQHGSGPSNYTTPTYVVTAQNMAFHGGNQNRFDPENGYRNEYKKIWGK
jgi:ribose transport system substrate-binding protein